MIRHCLMLAAAVTVSGCANISSPEAGAARPGAQAVLAGSDGAIRGQATFSENATGVAVRVEAQGLSQGAHGIHVHTVGRCEAPSFESAGPHWNPTARKHGRDNPDGAHHGDLPNIEIGSDGRGTLNFVLPAARFADLFDADGAALLVHASADDYRTDPSGNSGGRIACGVISRR